MSYYSGNRGSDEMANRHRSESNRRPNNNHSPAGSGGRRGYSGVSQPKRSRGDLFYMMIFSE